MILGSKLRYVGDVSSSELVKGFNGKNKILNLIDCSCGFKFLRL